MMRLDKIHTFLNRLHIIAWLSDESSISRTHTHTHYWLLVISISR